MRKKVTARQEIGCDYHCYKDREKEKVEIKISF